MKLPGIFLALASVSAYAGGLDAVVEPVIVTPGNVYVGIMGGWGSSNEPELNKFGTAYFIESSGGPLAVNAFGHTNSRSARILGAQVGYQWTDTDTLFDTLSLTPAFEIEGYYLSKSNFTGHEINSNTERLDEHDFLVTYPINANVFLVNAVLGFNFNRWVTPYVGLGMGGAVISISDAQAIQVSPPELNVNHYNAKPSDKESAFAGQVKIGLNYAATQYISIFGEYRWLYLAPSSYTFGSTVYPGHAETSAWQVDLGSQQYNMGVIGIRATF